MVYGGMSYYKPAFAAGMLGASAYYGGRKPRPYNRRGNVQQASSQGYFVNKRLPVVKKKKTLKDKIRQMESAQHHAANDQTLTQALKHNTMYIHNVTANILTGTSNSTRTNDTIYLEAIKLNGYYGTSTSLTNGQKFRVVVFWTDLFNNTGTTGFSSIAISNFNINSTGGFYSADFIFDPKKATVIYDESHTINQQIASVSDVSQVIATIPLKKSFNYLPNGNGAGSDRNLYVGVLASSSGGTAGTTDTGTFYLSYDTIFRNSK